MVNGDYVMTTCRLQGERKDKAINIRSGRLMCVTAAGQIAEGWGFTNDHETLDDFFTD